MTSHSNLSFPGYVSITTFAHGEFGSDIYFTSKEEFESGLSPVRAFLLLNIEVPQAIIFFTGRTTFFFYSFIFEGGYFLISSLSTNSASSSATTVKIVHNLDSNHPAWADNVQHAAKELTLTTIASIDFNWHRFEDLLSTRLLSSSFIFSSIETNTTLKSILHACFLSALSKGVS
jgi:hypothetical protein